MKFQKYTKKVNLTPAEKKQIRDNLNAFVAFHPLVRKQASSRHIFWRFPNPLLILNTKPMIATLIAAVLVAFGGGTAAAAENTLPGDWLYSMKVKVNEEVRSALSLTSEAKVAWDARRAERRLEEVEKLSEQGKLTTSTAQMLANKFKKFSEKTEARLQKLQDNGKLSAEQVDRLKENFEVALEAHNTVLERAQDREKLKSVVDSLKVQASSTIRQRLNKEQKLVEENTTSTLKNVAENRKNAANNKIAEVEKFIENNKDKVGAGNLAEAVKKIGEAKATVAAGDSLFNEGKYAGAIEKYSKAHRQAQEAKKYLSTNFHLEKLIENNSASTTLLNGKGKINELVKKVDRIVGNARRNGAAATTTVK